MMTEQAAINFGNWIAAQLKTTEPLAQIADVVCALMPMLDAAHFQAWGQRFVDDGDTTATSTSPAYRERIAYRERVQQLNMLLAKMSPFLEAVRRFHAWKQATTTP